MTEKEELVLRGESTQKIRSELFVALMNGYSKVVNNGQQSKENQALNLDLNVVRTKHPNEWTPEQLQAVLEILLHSCQIYLTRPHLSIPPLRRILVFSGNQDNSNPLLPSTSFLTQNYYAPSAQNSDRNGINRR
jgi:hypothetical protein